MAIERFMASSGDLALSNMFMDITGMLSDQPEMRYPILTAHALELARGGVITSYFDYERLLRRNDTRYFCIGRSITDEVRNNTLLFKSINRYRPEFVLHIAYGFDIAKILRGEFGITYQQNLERLKRTGHAVLTQEAQKNQFWKNLHS